MEMDDLSDRQKKIIQGLWFDMKRAETVGEELNLTGARVLQIAQKAQRKVMSRLSSLKEVSDALSESKIQIRLLEYKVLKLEKRLSEQEKPVPTVDEIDIISIEDLDLSVRLYNALFSGRVRTIGDIKNLTLADFKKIRNVGKKSIEELSELMIQYNIKWP